MFWDKTNLSFEHEYIRVLDESTGPAFKIYFHKLSDFFLLIGYLALFLFQFMFVYNFIYYGLIVIVGVSFAKAL